jgi:pilus assembly protein Flp/PilA
MTKKLYAIACRVQIWKNEKGQDLIEYALMAGFVAVAAGAVMPSVANQVGTIFSKVNSQLSEAAAQGTAS